MAGAKNSQGCREVQRQLRLQQTRYKGLFQKGPTSATEPARATKPRVTANKPLQDQERVRARDGVGQK